MPVSRSIILLSMNKVKMLLYDPAGLTLKNHNLCPQITFMFFVCTNRDYFSVQYVLLTSQWFL